MPCARMRGGELRNRPRASNPQLRGRPPAQAPRPTIATCNGLDSVDCGVTVVPAAGVRLALPYAPNAPQFSPDDVDHTVRTGCYITRGCRRAARHARASTARTELLASRAGDRM